jgi:GNAT superfamily N-acetyltransferase
MPRLDVRDARPDECAALTALALASKAHWGYDDAFMTACRAELTLEPADLQRARVRVADRGGVIVGFAGVALAPEPELEWLFVAPDAMGAGVGRLLLDDVSRLARAAGVQRLRIESDPHAEAFYVGLGARRIGHAASASVPGRVLPLLTLDVRDADSERRGRSATDR